MMEIQSDMSSKDKFLEQTLAIDFGNSRVKLLYKNIYKSFKYSDKFEEEFINFFRNKVSTPLRVLFSSVNFERSDKIINFLSSQPNVYIYNTRELILKQKKLNIFNYHWVGADRILGLIGALDEFSPPLITIDIGTAVTVNCVDGKRDFIGGVIFPGPETQAKSIQENTFLLKNVKFDRKDFENVLEVSTEYAIASGIINSIWGGLLYIVNRISIQYFNGADVPVIFTGGGFSYFKSKYQAWEYPKKFYRKNLVLSGIISIAKSERQYLINFGEA